MILFFMVVIGLISMILILLNYFIGVKCKVGREKSSIFECGFDPSASSRLPFSMHFFLIALIFLIFDVEISLLLPLPFAWSMSSHTTLLWLTLGVLLVLLVGALVEWCEGSLEWHI